MYHIKIIGYTSAITSAILLGSLGIFVRNINSNEFVITFFRLSIGLVLLTFFLFITGKLKKIKIQKFSFFLLSTGVSMSFGVLCYIKTIGYTSLTNAVFLLFLGPPIAVGVAFIFLKENFTLLNGGVLFAAFLGFLFLLEFNFSIDIDELKGYLWGTASGIFYALFIVFNRKIPENIHALTRSFYQSLFGAITILPFLTQFSLVSLSSEDIIWLVAVGFLQGFLALTLMIIAIKYLRTIEYVTVSYVEPLVASLIGYIIYSESLSLLQIIGCIIISLGGIVQVIMSEKNKNGAAEQTGSLTIFEIP